MSGCIFHVVSIFTAIKQNVTVPLNHFKSKFMSLILLLSRDLVRTRMTQARKNPNIIKNLTKSIIIYLLMEKKIQHPPSSETSVTVSRRQNLEPRRPSAPAQVQRPFKNVWIETDLFRDFLVKKSHDEICCSFLGDPNCQDEFQSFFSEIINSNA